MPAFFLACRSAGDAHGHFRPSRRRHRQCRRLPKSAGPARAANLRACAELPSLHWTPPVPSKHLNPVSTEPVAAFTPEMEWNHIWQACVILLRAASSPQFPCGLLFVALVTPPAAGATPISRPSSRQMPTTPRIWRVAAFPVRPREEHRGAVDWSGPGEEFQSLPKMI